MLAKLTHLFSLLIALPLSANISAAQDADKPLLHPIFANGMVLQQQKDIVVWGWSTPNERVTVRFAENSVVAKVNEHGRWEARFDALPATGMQAPKPYQLDVSDATTQHSVSNILIGEVWLCSGQSNMRWSVSKSEDPEAALRQANNANIRLFNIDRHLASQAQLNLHEFSPWKTANADSVSNFSAACYFFGKELQLALQVPIGLIHSSWGGTKIEAWTSRGTLQKQAVFTDALAQLDRFMTNPEIVVQELDEARSRWWQENDMGHQVRQGWSRFDYEDEDWSIIALPGQWEKSELPGFDGIVWFRKKIVIDEELQNQPFMLSLGMIDDEDETWVNGVNVGSNEHWNSVREYNVPAGLLKQGENTIAVRVFDGSGDGGFYSASSQLYLKSADTNQVIPLAGDWRYRVSQGINSMTKRPQPALSKDTPSVLYNAMIAPIRSLQIKGVTWYQGESNVNDAGFYQTQLSELIRDWREAFAQELDFHIVQLAAFLPQNPDRNKLAWPQLRESQRLVAEQDPKVGIAVTIDIGDAFDIHPKNKLDVGKRLARSALHISYGKDIVPSGPSPLRANRELNRVIVEFAHAKGGLALTEGESVMGFELCDAAMQCKDATATIVGSQIHINADSINEAAIVRYAYKENPQVNLANTSGLPAIPFSIGVN